MRTLDDLIATGEALIEARRNPGSARERFADFAEAYDRWNVAGKDLIRKLSGRSAAGRWSAGECRAMYSLDLDPAVCLREQERQQAMLIALRGRSMAAPATPHARKQTATNSENVPREQGVPRYVMKPDGREWTNEELLEDLRRAAKALGKSTVTFEEYPRQGQCASRTLLKRFGGWNKALQAAGLEVGARRGIPTEELFENVARVWQALGRQPLQTELVKPLSAFSVTPYQRRFGSWLRALRAFVAWANEGENPKEADSARPAAPPKTPRFPNLRLRSAVLLRDSFKCTACGRSPATHPGVCLNVDHMIPWSKGGPTTLENLTTLCEDCNLGKSNSDCRMQNDGGVA